MDWLYKHVKNQNEFIHLHSHLLHLHRSTRIFLLIKQRRSIVRHIVFSFLFFRQSFSVFLKLVFYSTGQR